MRCGFLFLPQFHSAVCPWTEQAVRPLAFLIPFLCSVDLPKLRWESVGVKCQAEPLWACSFHPRKQIKRTRVLFAVTAPSGSFSHSASLNFCYP